MNENDIHQILSRALGADESGNKEQAIQCYMEAVEAILKIGDRELRAKLNRFATQSLDRAEQLKGVRRPEVAHNQLQAPESGPAVGARTIPARSI